MKALIMQSLAALATILALLPFSAFSNEVKNASITPEEASIIKKTLSFHLSNASSLGVAAQLGINVMDAIELGVEGTGSFDGAYGAGLYAKKRLGESRFYAVTSVGRTNWHRNDSNRDNVEHASIGVGYILKSGAFIEARTGTMKTNWKNPCVHNDYGDCTDGGSKKSTLLMFNVGTAF